QKSLTEISEATDRVGQIRNLSYLFSFIFILLAILAMFTTIQRLIDGQTKEIAVLKALGFSNQAISLHYILFGLVVSLLGSFAGFAISPLMSWFVLETQKSMFTLPNWQISYSSSSIVVGIVVIIICVLAAYLASRESARGLPAIFLRGKEKVAKSVFVERFSSIWQRISYPSRWAIRDASFNRIRVLMGIVGVAGSMMLLIAGIGMP
ncbi:FtsX-like permease family protein, partial [Sphingomonas sp. NCPPB 2930]